ncbi:MAG: L-glutamate gamma-semialdehyde dehydrogenase [Planctomyces sp.]|jgi:RHH-type proline utilization regulon transcriptional repressor/proline dehydrogenase/delta 1-pyrroline-5-carboxylate dehydrogenase
MAKKALQVDQIENRTQEIGRELFDRLDRRGPSIFHGRWWEDRLLSWAMTDEAVRVQMFRFVDVLPMLRDHASIARHLEEYFEDVRDRLPWAARLGLEMTTGNSILSRALAYNARTNAARMARRFIAGSSPEEVLRSVRRLRNDGYAFTLDLLGESVISDRQADRYQQDYLQLLSSLAPQVNDWPDDVLLDRDHIGPIPRVNLSIKLSALDSQFSPVDAEGTISRVAARLRPILRLAREHQAHIHFDMEQHDYKNLTLEIFRRILMEKEFRDWPDAGIVVQSYLQNSEKDLRELLAWAKKRGTSVVVRLVKGAYWDYETIVAESRNWPVPVFQQKWESDESFEKLTDILLTNQEWLRPAIASHNLRSLAHALACGEQNALPDGAFEIQMLYGMCDEQAQLFLEHGCRVRIYAPFGELIPGMSYLVRRLLENTSNDSFLRQNFTDHLSVEKLLMKPSRRAVSAVVASETSGSQFRNEPLTDFSVAENRDLMVQALADVKDQFGQIYPLVIDGKSCDSRATIVSRNPSCTSEIIGRIASASPEQALDAVNSARRSFPAWAALDTGTRAEYLELIAAEMRERRFELAAWIIFECGKPWTEADADVAEAIDFCMYYAAQARRLSEPQHCDLKGEENTYQYRPRGVCVVIAPWNFPLAILTGMTAAAMVTGNTVVMKPAEQASVTAAKLMEIVRNASIPDGVINYLPGVGEDIGPALVQSPDVDLIAFTGSQEVGLEINRVAADTDSRQMNVKRVIAEMGGKNTIIVDDDADLDEAVLGVVRSAFGYSGQKCSACSRVVVLEGVYDQFVKRLVEATESLKIGAADDPATRVGPLIDEEARERILQVIRKADPEIDGALALAMDPGPAAKKGTFLGPHIFVGVDPTSVLAQKELFGPVLAVIRVRTLDQAFSVANGTRYALTGGVYSRSPVTLKRARNEFQVGNLYLNREITGAVVGRHPFGGYRMSGIGSKAGGPDYLIQYVHPINITENTMRHGFAPQAVEEKK